MATPGRATRQSALKFEDELSGEGRPRQRNRRIVGGESMDDSITWDLTDDGRPKTRRVNPQRLAIRLGPELVAEMEAYIVPGAKMPPFSIRKDFQERYSVDRRHIYDYFHSRGLRVAKEDKHTNLVRGRAMKLNVLGQTSSVSQTSSKAPSEAMERVSVDKASPLFIPKSANNGTRPTKRTTKIREKKSAVVRRSTASTKTLKKSRGPVRDMLDCLLVPSEKDGELSVSGSDTDWDSTPISPQFTLACDSSDEIIVTSGAASDFLPPLNDFLSGFFAAPDHLPQTFSDIEIFPVDGIPISVDQERLLTKGERAELYDLISGSMTSSVSVGSAQSSDTLLSVDNTDRGGRLYHENQGKSHLAWNAFEPSHCDSHDLKRWLFDDLDVQLTMDIDFLPSLSDNLNGYPGFYETPIVNSGYGMTCDYPQAILSSQNRLPSSKPPNSVACVKQHIAGHAKRDVENMNPGTYFNSR